MSVVDERGALDHSTSLFAHARRLHRLTPDGPLPDGGHPLPDDGDRPYVPYAERKAALRAVLREYLGDPTRSVLDLHERCTRLAVTARDVALVRRELDPEASPRLVGTARWLVENGTDRGAVLVGLGLLDGHAEHRDVPMLRIIGRLRFAEQPAVEALAKVPNAGRDVIWLAERSREYSRIVAVRALVGDPDPVVRQWVLSTPSHLLSSDLARQIAERCSLAELDDLSWVQAGGLVLAMTSTRDYRSEISRYAPAAIAYQRWFDRARTMPATLERAARLASVADDLCTGRAAPVVGDRRPGLLDQIEETLTSAPWAAMLARSAHSSDPVEARRAAWILATSGGRGIPVTRFAVRVVVPDPKPVGFPRVEARVVVDGMPIVAAVFDKGPAEEPERLIFSGRLRATGEPEEIRLAEADCTEGCCGGLNVTIVRDGPEVVWKDWRSSMPGDPPPEVRFDVPEYDREVARAERDHDWEWPARTLARLVADQLRADPTILGRWDCVADWCTAWLTDVDAARLTFRYPARTGSSAEPFVQFGLVVDVRDRVPEVLAAELVESMRITDPRSVAEIVGGGREAAERLGLTYRKPTRW